MTNSLWARNPGTGGGAGLIDLDGVEILLLRELHLSILQGLRDGSRRTMEKISTNFFTTVEDFVWQHGKQMKLKQTRQKNRKTLHSLNLN